MSDRPWWHIHTDPNWTWQIYVGPWRVLFALMYARHYGFWRVMKPYRLVGHRRLGGVPYRELAIGGFGFEISRLDKLESA